MKLEAQGVMAGLPGDARLMLRPRQPRVDAMVEAGGRMAEAGGLAGLLRRFADSSSGNMPDEAQEAVGTAIGAVMRVSEGEGPPWLTPGPGMAAALEALDRLASEGRARASRAEETIAEAAASACRPMRRWFAVLDANGASPRSVARVAIAIGRPGTGPGTKDPGCRSEFAVEWIKLEGMRHPAPRVEAFDDGLEALAACADLLAALREGAEDHEGGTHRALSRAEACEAMEKLGYERVA